MMITSAAGFYATEVLGKDKARFLYYINVNNIEKL